jgi:catechol 2,3-dioxygenase-like lactoylglutathione lyase family enzyme
MFTIGRNFHVIHMTDDLDVLDAWYDDVFSVTRWMTKGFSADLVRDASLVGIGDLCIEPMAPSFRVDGWDKVPIGRFFKRFGAQWHSVAWYVDDAEGLTELYHRLVDDKVEMLDVLGGHLDEQGLVQRPIFTHPRGTVTQLEFMVPGAMLPDPRIHVSYRSTWWHDTHPLHIRKQSHITLATRDLDAAKHTYVDVIGGTLLHEGEGDAQKTRSVYVAVGQDMVVELAEPLESATPIADFLDAYPNGGLFSVMLQAERYLASKAITPRLRDAQTFLSDPATTYGANWGFTTMEIPNDTRADW